MFKAAPNPNAARLLQSYMLSAECQQLIIDFGGLRSAHSLVKDKPGRKPLKEIKMMKDDAGRRSKSDSDEIKARYTQHLQSLRHRMDRGFSRRGLLKGSGALALGLSATPRAGGGAAGAATTPALIAAAKKEGKVVYYTSIDLPLAEKIAKSFEAKYPGIAVRVERTGAERVFTRIGQEYASNIHAVDVVNSSDAAHFIVWKRKGWLAPFVPEDVAKFYPDDHKDPDGLYASFRIGLSIIAYNTNLVKSEDAPKSFADLLDPKWKGKLVKAHPGYSGTIMTATYQMARDLGWGYFEKLAQQNVLQVQSATDTPKKIALGERAIMVDGNEYNISPAQGKGQPVEPVYATEGTPLIVGPNGSSRMRRIPTRRGCSRPSASRRECQQLIVDAGGLRSAHPQVKEKPGRKPFKEIKTMKEDAAGVEKNGRRDQGAIFEVVQSVRPSSRPSGRRPREPGAG